MSIGAIEEKLLAFGSEELDHCCLTGGEPLLHEALPSLAQRLVECDVTVLVETNGSQDIAAVPPPIVRIMDIKCPGSVECGSLLSENVRALTPRDEVKFVVADRRDFDWALDFTRRHSLQERCEVLLSPVWGELDGGVLAGWLLDSGLKLRLQIQLHKVLSLE
jgi:7-carboxy-7-deazaguanine synthase